MRMTTWRHLCLGLTLVLAASETVLAGDDENPKLAPHLRAPASTEARDALPTGGSGVQPVYFVPQDSDANGTVILLYNTTATDVTVPLKGFASTGALVFSLNVSLPAHAMLHLVSDSVVTSPPPSWANNSTAVPPVTNVVVTNFTDFTAYAQLLLPTGVKVDGYVEWNPGTGVIDPRAAAARVPLRFSVGGDAP